MPEIGQARLQTPGTSEHRRCGYGKRNRDIGATMRWPGHHPCRGFRMAMTRRRLPQWSRRAGETAWVWSATAQRPRRRRSVQASLVALSPRLVYTDKLAACAGFQFTFGGTAGWATYSIPRLRATYALPQTAWKYRNPGYAQCDHPRYRQEAQHAATWQLRNHCGSRQS